jgi:hypothetical protein
MWEINKLKDNISENNISNNGYIYNLFSDINKLLVKK